MTAPVVVAVHRDVALDVHPWGIERNQEVKRQRFLRPDEIARLTATLAALPDQQAANIVRLLALTGFESSVVMDDGRSVAA